MSLNLMELLPQIERIAKQAGDAILAIYHADAATQNITQKADESPLTAADLASHDVIMKGLTALTPDIPKLSEESADISWEERQQWQCYWLIDPLDGTKEFIKRNGEFTVNIALVDNGVPVLSVVYAPVLNKSYSGVLGEGAWLDDGQQRRQLDISNQQKAKVTRVVGSRSHPSEHMQTFLEQLDEVEVVPVGSSLKLCMVAEGNAEIYPRLGPTCEWDTAAGHCVALSAGAVVLNSKGEPLTYNQKESLLNPWFLVAGPAYKTLTLP